MITDGAPTDAHFTNRATPGRSKAGRSKLPTWIAYHRRNRPGLKMWSIRAFLRRCRICPWICITPSLTTAMLPVRCIASSRCGKKSIAGFQRHCQQSQRMSQRSVPLGRRPRSEPAAMAPRSLAGFNDDDHRRRLHVDAIPERRAGRRALLHLARSTVCLERQFPSVDHGRHGRQPHRAGIRQPDFLPE